MKRFPIFLWLLACSGLFADSIWFHSLEYYTTLNYNSATGIILKQKISVAHYGDETDFFITLSGGRSGDPMNRRLNNKNGYGASYQLVNNPSDKVVIKDLGALSGENEILIGHLDAGNSTTDLEYYLVMEPDLYLPYGYLTDAFELNLYIGDLDNYRLAQTAILQAAMISPRVAYLSIVPEGGSFNKSRTNLTMDFGWLTKGARRSADILVLANLPYSLSLHSRNYGKLKYSDWRPPNNGIRSATIPYTCYVNGSAIDLSRYYVEIGSADISEENGDRYTLDFVIGDFWDVPSGIFEDTITVTLSAW